MTKDTRQKLVREVVDGPYRREWDPWTVAAETALWLGLAALLAAFIGSSP